MLDSRKTWFLDFDGTLVEHRSHYSDKDYILPATKEFFSASIKENDFVIITTARNGDEHKERIAMFMDAHGLKYDVILCDLPSGVRILVNDQKPDGSTTAIAVNLKRDKGIEEKIS